MNENIFLENKVPQKKKKKKKKKKKYRAFCKAKWK